MTRPLAALIDEHNRLAYLVNSGSDHPMHRSLIRRYRRQINRRKRNAAKRANL